MIQNVEKAKSQSTPMINVEYLSKEKLLMKLKNSTNKTFF